MVLQNHQMYQILIRFKVVIHLVGLRNALELPFKNYVIGTNHSNKKLDSSVGIKGLIKHGIVLLLVLVLYPYMVVLNFLTYANSIVLFYIFNYGISIIENLNDMGIKLPNSIRKYLK